MKFTPLLALIASVHAHSIFQKVSVNGVDQGQLKGVRAPDSDNPLYSVTDANLACNTGITHKDNTLITVPQGAKVGAWWGHVIGGAQGSNDPDNPIAVSHKGPIQVYLAKVDDATTTGTSGLKWFKVAEEGLNNGKWAVDTMIANNGWWYFNMPSCVTAGQYLMRVELLALHSAYSSGGAQFYMECAQIQVTGSGTSSPATVSIPGVYGANDPSIVISIYGNTGLPDNGGKPYTIPGPRPLSCSGSGSGSGSGPSPSSSSIKTVAPTTTSKQATTLKTSAVTTTTTAASGGGAGAALYGQCGGTGYTGPTTCASGTCKVSNQYYSQCLP